MVFNRKLQADNVSMLKNSIQLTFSLTELEDYITIKSQTPEDANFDSWCKIDLKAKDIIGLTLSDSNLEQVHHAAITKDM